MPTKTLEEIAETRRRQFEKLNEQYGPCREVPVLMYHHVEDFDTAKEGGFSNLNVRPEIFLQQIDYLINKGYRIIDLGEMMIGLKNNSLPPKPVILTFDDGYRDFYENVFPVLKEKGVKATLFVISQFVGGEQYVNWQQLREMVGSNLVLVGDHTLSHLYLPKLSDDDQEDQIVSAKKIIEENLGVSIRFFAYPYGGYNSSSEEILGRSDFVAAVTNTYKGPQCAGLPYEISRRRIGEVSLSAYGL